MTIDNDASGPAGTDEGTFVPETLSVSAAAALMSQQDDYETAEGTTEATENDQDQGGAAAGAETEGDSGAEESAETDEESGSENTSENQPLDFETLPGEAVLRLRDGRQLTVGEIKKRWGDLEDLGKAKEAFQSDQTKFGQDRESFQTWAAQNAQQITLFQKLAPQAIAAIEASMPKIAPLPDPALLETNPYQHQQELARHLSTKADFEQKAAQVREIQQGQQLIQHREQVQQAEQLKSFIGAERGKLVEAIPELKNPEKAKAFYSDFLEAGRGYGFSDQELTAVYDHRLMLLTKDAMAYRKLMADKPKPTAKKDVAAAAPVAQPGKRQSAPEQRQQRKEDVLQRAKKSNGGLRELATLMSQYEKD